MFGCSGILCTPYLTPEQLTSHFEPFVGHVCERTAVEELGILCPVVVKDSKVQFIAAKFGHQPVLYKIVISVVYVIERTLSAGQ
ncbi:hypothetical protein SDC9_104876 [bioreactor metagenome]|uniref:Uncharacterized protein n=1 Tax=bioreactor metagenome TaxID=1076179 RepID=A0A645AY04_9ZZZZ